MSLLCHRPPAEPVASEQMVFSDSEQSIMPTLIQEKVDQAIGILRQTGVDAWLTFVRETSAISDPVLPLIYGHWLTWQSALLLARSGERIAIVGHFDALTAERTGAYTTVIPYHESIGPALLAALEQIQPAQIAINFSATDVHADGLTHGMYQLLCGYLKGTPWADRLVSAERIAAALRGRKTPEEIARIRRAVETTREIFEETFAVLRPGITEAELGRFMRRADRHPRHSGRLGTSELPSDQHRPRLACGSRCAIRSGSSARPSRSLRLRRAPGRLLLGYPACDLHAAAG